MPVSSMRSVKRKLGDGLDTRPFLRKQSEEEKDTTKESADSLQEKVESLSDQTNLISVKETVEGLYQSPHFLESRRAYTLEPAVTTKTLLVANLSPEMEISVLVSDIIDFFDNVAKVVRVQLSVTPSGEHRCCGFVKFASVKDAKKALETKNGEYLHGHKIILDVDTAARRPKYSIEHKVVWHEEDYRERLLIEEDYLKTKPSVKKPKVAQFCGKKFTFTDDGHLQQESLPIEEDEIPPDFVEEVLFVANLSPQTEMPHIIRFFKDIGEVHVRLIVNQEGKHVGYGFVEFFSSNEAKEALEKKNGEYLHDNKIFLDMAKTAPYPPQHKCNFAEKLCYEDYLLRVSFRKKEKEIIERLCRTPVFDEAVAVAEKTLYVYHFSRETNISHIIDFFKDVGGVVNVRLSVNHMGDHGGDCYVEFASSDMAKKALQKKNGKYLRDHKIVLEVAQMMPTKYCIEHKVWYEDYLRQESRLIKEDEAVEGLAETTDLVEEVDATKRTLFVAHLPLGGRTSEKLSDRVKDIFCFNVSEAQGIVSYRLVVNRSGEHVGCAFVEFDSANKAKEVLEKKKEIKYNRKILYDVVKAAPYPLRPKYSLAEKLWYEDYLRQFGEDYLETKSTAGKTDVFGTGKTQPNYYHFREIILSNGKTLPYYYHDVE